jgi:hypothetical protein
MSFIINILKLMQAPENSFKSANIPEATRLATPDLAFENVATVLTVTFALLRISPKSSICT